MDGLGFAKLGHPFLPPAGGFIPFPFGRRSRRQWGCFLFFFFFF
jgi:hypothetical protein